MENPDNDQNYQRKKLTSKLLRIYEENPLSMVNVASINTDSCIEKSKVLKVSVFIGDC